MDLVSAFAAPRLVELAGESFWIRPYCYDDLALILAWLDDVVPGRGDRKMPPSFSSPESQAALDSTNGRMILTWAALRHHRVSYPRACTLALECGPEEWLRFSEVVFWRRRTTKISPHQDKQDLAERWIGPSLVILAEQYHMSIDDIRGMTLDQLDCFASDGAAQEDPSIPSAEFMAELDRQARENAARKAQGNGTPAEAVP